MAVVQHSLTTQSRGTGKMVGDDPPGRLLADRLLVVDWYRRTDVRTYVITPYSPACLS